MTTVSPDKDEVERVARAIYDAPDSQSGDTVGDVIWDSSHLFYETKDGEEIVDTARRVTLGICRDAARAALAAMSPVDRLREALDDLADRVSDDDCAICGKSKSQHHTGSGYGVCQIYPCFVSKRTIFQRIGDAALSSPEPVGEGNE